MKLSYIYILTNKANSTLYIGVTANLIKRIWEHKNKIVSGFTSRYNVNKLVYFEEFEDISLAIARERRLKEWPRQWKINLINQKNPSWVDLYYLALDSYAEIPLTRSGMTRKEQQDNG